MRRVFWILVLAAASAAPHRSPAQWVQTGGPVGGYINALAEDDSFFYAATFGYIFRMQKGDTTWTPLSGVNSLVPGASSLATVGNVLVAGTDGGGAFWSTDRGMSWERWTSGLEQAQNIASFAASGSNLFAGTNSGVYLSTDHGATWVPRNTGQGSSGGLSLLIKDSTLFAGTVGDGVYRSTDFGATWFRADGGIIPDTAWVWSLVALDSVILAGTWWGEGIYRSTDNGTTWAVANQGLLNRDVHALAVFDTDIFAGTFGGVHRSTDRGNNWTWIDDGPGSIVMCFHASTAQILAGTMDGVYYSSDPGNSWNAAFDGMIATGVNAFLYDAGVLFAGGGGLLFSLNEGASWHRTHLQDMNVNSLIRSGSDFFAGTKHGVHRSTDGGMHWTSLDNGKDWVSSLALLPGGNFLFAGTDGSGVLLSTDRGTTWTPVNSGLADTSVLCLATSGSKLFAGTRSGVFLNADSGRTWNFAGAGPVGRMVQCLATSGSNVFAGTDGGGVFRTTDDGASWTPVNTGITDLNVHSLAAFDNRLFAGTWFGHLFLTEDSGNTWTRVDTGLVNLCHEALGFSGTDLFVGTRGAGVWRRPLQEMVTAVGGLPVGHPAASRLEQNYPNPFNPSTTIRYQLPRRVHVSLTVFDLLGREVAVLADAFQDAGYKSVNFDATDLPSGVYFYRLTAGEFVETKRFILVK